MARPPVPGSPEDLWQHQSDEEAMTMTLDAVRLRAETFQRAIHRRNVREYWAAAAAALVLGVGAWLLPLTITRVGLGAIFVGMVYVIRDLHRTGSARAVPGDLTAEACTDFHRRELIRQRDLLRRAGTRHIAALLPGVALMVTGTWLQRFGPAGDASEPADMWIFGAAWALAAAVLAAVSWLNLREARRLDRELDAPEAER